MTYEQFFAQVTGLPAPFPWQVRLASGDWPEIIDIPTGLGKTAGVVGAWLWRLLTQPDENPRRLVYCLPMRALVEQTLQVAEDLCAHAVSDFAARGQVAPMVHGLIGGSADDGWELEPARPAVLVGTQDMLLSRALNRGYGMNPFRWPVPFALLHNDALWVLDETQLMGVAVETSAQLEGFRRALGTLRPTRTIWMSATLGRAQLRTVDHPEPEGGFTNLSLDAADHSNEHVRKRTSAVKRLAPAGIVLRRKAEAAHTEAVAALAWEMHSERGGLTLLIVNRVARAQALFEALRQRSAGNLALVHSRFRRGDRRVHEAALTASGDRIVVATQAIEAGVDVSARTLLTELAPWSSLVQRFGRCNRYGEVEEGAEVRWLDLDVEDDADLARPYEPQDLVAARRLLESLDDVGRTRIREIEATEEGKIRPVLRRRDLLDLFDTSSDLLGNRVDVSRFVRDGQDTDVLVFYRPFDGAAPEGQPLPGPEETVAVSLSTANDFLNKLKKKRASLGTGERDLERRRQLRAWTPDELAKARSTPWVPATTAFPGQILLLHPAAGGYDPLVGWTGAMLPKKPVEVPSTAPGEPVERMGDDASGGSWVDLRAHLADVRAESATLAESLLPAESREPLVLAAAWHDVGKLHDQFQRRLLQPLRDHGGLEWPGDGPWAKSPHRLPPPSDVRPYFRHELASALAWRQQNPDHPQRDLIAYLIAAHHGKVRLAIRSVSGEQVPEDDRPFARGVWHGDEIPEFDGIDGIRVPAMHLDLAPVLLGSGSWAERTLALRDSATLGPFRLAFLEAVLRIADWRASAKEAGHA